MRMDVCCSDSETRCDYDAFLMRTSTCRNAVRTSEMILRQSASSSPLGHCLTPSHRVAFTHTLGEQRNSPAVQFFTAQSSSSELSPQSSWPLHRHSTDTQRPLAHVNSNKEHVRLPVRTRDTKRAGLPYEYVRNTWLLLLREQFKNAREHMIKKYMRLPVRAPDQETCSQLREPAHTVYAILRRTNTRREVRAITSASTQSRNECKHRREHRVTK